MTVEYGREHVPVAVIVPYEEYVSSESERKLDLEGVTPDVFPSAAEESGLAILRLDPSVAVSFHQLPREVHEDPFDRLIVWQAVRRRCMLISKDEALERYREHGLRVVW